MISRFTALSILLCALIVAATAGARPTATPGVSATSISIGSSGPLTGEAAAAAGVLQGADAYFKYANSRGGVNGRKINFKYLDDAYDPSKTVQNVRELIQQDNVFALFSIVGTNSNLAIRDFTNASGVPQVFSAAGATTFGRDYVKYPWTIGYLPPYAEEGKIYARNILATAAKTAKIAVLYQNDDYGKDLLSGFRSGLGTQARKFIVQTVGYDPTTSDVQSQVAQLKSSGANTFMIFAFGKFAIQSFVYANKLGWKPKIYVNDVASASSIMKLDPQTTAEGSISILWGKDPATPKFAKDAGVALAAKIIKRYAP
ncbi:MAG: ABC transporter substrate-binding protein, partial [Gaiellaceae bacterium]